MAVQAAIALKAEQDEEQARLGAERETNGDLVHREHVLQATRDENMRLLASMDHARQVAQQTADIETDMLSALAKAVAKEARKARALTALGSGPRNRGNIMPADTVTTLGATTTPRRALAPPVAVTAPVGASTHPQVNTPLMARAPTLPTTCAGTASGDRDSTPRRR